MSATEQQTTMRSAGLIGLAALGGALIGFGLQLLVAYYFGASHETDSFFMAQSTSELLSKLLLGGSITAVFLPLFVERIAQGRREEAWELGLNLLHLAGLVMAVLLVLVGLFAEPFVQFVAPGFDAATQALTVRLLRVLLPSFLFLFLVDLIVAMLHAVRHFAIPASLRLVAPLTSMIMIMLLVRELGIFAFAVGVVAGSLLQLGLVVWGLRRQGFRYRFVLRPRDPALTRLLYLVYPFLFSVLVTQGSGIIHRILVSELSAGSLSALRFAEKITQLLILMFLNSITVVIFPVMSEKAGRHDMVGLHATIAAALRLIVFLMVPLSAGVILLREELVSFLFQRGSFSADDAALTSLALLFLVLGLTTNGISSVLGHATLALKQTRAAVAVTIATQFLAAALFVLLTPRFGLAGLALAAAVVPIGISLLYFLYLTRFVPRLWSVFYHPTYLRTVLLTLGLIGAVWLTQQLTWTALPWRWLQQLVSLLIPAAAGITLYFGGAQLWGVPEMQDVTALVRGKLAKWRR